MPCVGVAYVTDRSKGQRPRNPLPLVSTVYKTMKREGTAVLELAWTLWTYNTLHFIHPACHCWWGEWYLDMSLEHWCLLLATGVKCDLHVVWVHRHLQWQAGTMCKNRVGPLKALCGKLGASLYSHWTLPVIHLATLHPLSPPGSPSSMTSYNSCKQSRIKHTNWFTGSRWQPPSEQQRRSNSKT